MDVFRIRVVSVIRKFKVLTVNADSVEKAEEQAKLEAEKHESGWTVFDTVYVADEINWEN